MPSPMVDHQDATHLPPIPKLSRSARSLRARGHASTPRRAAVVSCFLEKGQDSTLQPMDKPPRDDSSKHAFDATSRCYTAIALSQLLVSCDDSPSINTRCHNSRTSSCHRTL